MKVLRYSFLFLSLFFAHAQELILQDSYTFEGNKVYAVDLFPELKHNFELLNVPDHLHHISIAKQRIFELFKREGITLTGRPLGSVRFKRFQNLDLVRLEMEVAQYYQKNLPFLTINSVTVEPKGKIDKLPEHYTLELKKQAYKNHEGSFKILFDRQRLFFSFSVDASYSEFQALDTLKRGELITSQNTQMQVIPFTRYKRDLIGYEDLGQVTAKRHLQKGKAITLKDVKKVPLIKKGSIVNVKLIEGNILIHFQATALSSGDLGEHIMIRRSDNSQLKVKIVGANKVIVE